MIGLECAKFVRTQNSHWEDQDAEPKRDRCTHPRGGAVAADFRRPGVRRIKISRFLGPVAPATRYWHSMGSDEAPWPGPAGAADARIPESLRGKLGRSGGRRPGE